MADEATDVTTTELTVTPEETKVESVAEQAPIDEPAAVEEKVESEAEETPAETEGDKPEESKELEKTEEVSESKDPTDPKVIAQQAFRQRQKTREAVAKTIDDNYQAKTQEDLIAEGVSEADAKVEALRQEIEFERTRSKIAETNANLQADAQNVLRDFAIFNPDSPEFDKDFAEKVQARYQRVARLETDANGIVLNAEEGLYDFYADMAEVYNGGAKKGKVQGQKDALTMLSRTDTASKSETPQSDKKAEDMTIEEMEAKYGMVRR